MTGDRSAPAATVRLAVPADALTDNARARGVYKAAGWRPDGAVRTLDFDGTPIEEIRDRR